MCPQQCCQLCQTPTRAAAPLAMHLPAWRLRGGFEPASPLAAEPKVGGNGGGGRRSGSEELLSDLLIYKEHTGEISKLLNARKHVGLDSTQEVEIFMFNHLQQRIQICVQYLSQHVHIHINTCQCTQSVGYLRLEHQYSELQ